MYSLYIALPDTCNSHRPNTSIDQTQAMLQTLQRYRDTYGPLSRSTIMLDNLCTTTHTMAATICENIMEHDDTSSIGEVTATIDIWDDKRVSTIHSVMTSRLPHANRYRYTLPITSLDINYHAAQGHNSVLIHIRELTRKLLHHKDHQTHYAIELTAREEDLHNTQAGSGYLWSRPAQTLLHNILHSGLVSNVSVGYVLPPTQQLQIPQTYYAIQHLLHDTGYIRHHRYHYAIRGAYSIHQSTYDAYTPYLGIGPGAVSMIYGIEYGAATPSSIWGYTRQIPYVYESVESSYKKTTLRRDTFLTNMFLQRLASTIGIDNLSTYTSILRDDYTDQIEQLIQSGRLTRNTYDTIQCTSIGWDNYNDVVTTLIHTNHFT